MTQTHRKIAIFSVLFIGLTSIQPTYANWLIDLFKPSESGLLASPSWLSPAIRYTSYALAGCIASKVLWDATVNVYENFQPVSYFSEKKRTIPQHRIDNCSNKFMQNLLLAYNNQHIVNPQQLRDIQHLIGKNY